MQYQQPGMAPAGGGQQIAGIAKNISWQILFFVAACFVLAASIISILALVLSFQWAPLSTLNQFFLLIFGLLMFVLDFPLPVNQLPPAVSNIFLQIRTSIYKFMLFMARFTGRGVWYLFLSTMVFAALWDLNISQFLGACLGLYVGILGLVALIYGFTLSYKLDRVRKDLRSRPHQCPPQGFTLMGFRDLAFQATQTNFTDDELNYVFNGLSLTPKADLTLSPQEYGEWLSPGGMPIL